MDTKSPTQSAPPRSRHLLVRALRVVIILGVGVCAMLMILAAGPSPSRDTEMGQAMALVENVRDMTRALASQDSQTPALSPLDQLDGKTFSPAVDAKGQPLADKQAWSQTLIVQNVDPAHVTQVVARGTTPARRVTVKVEHIGHHVCDVSWLVFDSMH